MKTLQEMALPLFNEDPDQVMRAALRGGSDRALGLAFLAIGDAQQFIQRIADTLGESTPEGEEYDGLIDAFQKKAEILVNCWQYLHDHFPLAMSIPGQQSALFEFMISGHSESIDYETLARLEGQMAATRRDNALTKWLEANPHLSYDAKSIADSIRREAVNEEIEEEYERLGGRDD